MAFKSDRLVKSLAREGLPLPVTGLVLSGGKSRRMGRDKAFLPFQGTTMIAHILAEIRDLFSDVFVVANEPDLYEGLGVDVVKDILPHRGPLGGILSGLLVSSNQYAFVVACDMPLIDKQLIREMASMRHENDVVVFAHDKEIEPLLGFYSKSCIKPLEESLFVDNLKVENFLSGLKAKTFSYKSDAQSGSLPPYFNVNTPQDYSRVVTGYGANSIRFLRNLL